MPFRRKTVIPVAVELVPLERNTLHLLRRYRLARRVIVGVQLGTDRQTATRRRVANQVHHHLQAHQRPTSPVLRDVTEHPVLDLVPLARARWKMAHRDPKPRLVRQLLQLPLPQAVAAPIGTPAVSRDQQAPRRRIRHATHPPPPAPQRLHRERRRVVIDAHAHPARVAGQIVDPVRNRLAEGRVREVVNPNPFRVAARTPLPTGVLERADELLLLGVHRHHRLALPLKSLHLPVDVVELRVPVRMLSPLQRLAIRLQTVA